MMRQKKMIVYMRWFIQILFFVMAPSIFTAAFAGVKTIFIKIGAGNVVELSSFVTALIGIALFTVVFGRFFCGYACAFGTLGDLIYQLSIWVQKKMKRKLPKIPDRWFGRLQKVKYLVLTILLLLCFLGMYDKTKGWSPWDVFSRISTGNFALADYIPGLMILLLILVGMAVQERFFCQFLCPMGAVFALLPILPVSILRRDRENCIKNCSACRRKCPVHLSIDGDSMNSGECLQCQQCVPICPKENISAGYLKDSKKRYLLAGTIGKATLLLALAAGLHLLRVG